jgi:uncharacterized protein with FMN-binding domain
LKIVQYGIIVIILAVLLVGCPTEPDIEGEQKHAPYGTFTGNVEGMGTGGYGGPITVQLTLQDGYITVVNVIHNETTEFGATLIEKVKPLIVAANSFEIDAITNATTLYTKTALAKAGQAALDKIGDGPTDPNAGKIIGGGATPFTVDGKTLNGTASGTSFGYYGDITVTLTLANGLITVVAIDGNETPEVGQVYVENAPEYIKALNSIDAGVDAVSGPTANITVPAILEAADNALKKIAEKS